MGNKIQLRFKLDNVQKIGFDVNDNNQEFFEGMETMRTSGIEIKSIYYDQLCKNTISNGHNLLKSRGIFNIDSSVVDPMSKIIGQYLFRVLFGDDKFQDYLHLAKKGKKELEIILEFDLPDSNNDSKTLASLPWELMYCPEINKPAGEEYNEDGFFISKFASIYRKYKKEVTDEMHDVNREVIVSVAFLPKDGDNINEQYQHIREIAARIEEKNSNIHFEFINSTDKEDTVFNLLSREDLERIFLINKNSDTKKKINKIVHLICDISSTEYNQKLEKAFYFSNAGNFNESYSFPEAFRELFNKLLLQDPSLKLLVLQAWADEKNVYSGFEEIAIRVIKQNQTAIISMPYVLNQSLKGGRDAFFETLYSGLADSLPTIEVVQNLRKNLVQKYSYGFPLFYLNGSDQVLVSQENINQARANSGLSKNADNRTEKYFERYKNATLETLEENQKVLIEKLNFIISADQDEGGRSQQFSDKKQIEELNLELSVIKKSIVEKK